MKTHLYFFHVTLVGATDFAVSDSDGGSSFSFLSESPAVAALPSVSAASGPARPPPSAALSALADMFSSSNAPISLGSDLSSPALPVPSTPPAPTPTPAANPYGYPQQPPAQQPMQSQQPPIFGYPPAQPQSAYGQVYTSGGMAPPAAGGYGFPPQQSQPYGGAYPQPPPQPGYGNSYIQYAPQSQPPQPYGGGAYAQPYMPVPATSPHAPAFHVSAAPSHGGTAANLTPPLSASEFTTPQPKGTHDPWASIGPALPK
jgi:hypothetical protein